MKKFMKDSKVIYLFGYLSFQIAYLSKNSYVKSLLPIFVAIQLIGVFFMMRDLRKNILQDKKEN